MAKTRKRKTKIDKILDWLSERSQKDCHAEFVRYVSPPRNTTGSEIETWLVSRMEVAVEEGGELPFKVYCGDIVAWKDNNQELLAGQMARSLSVESGRWLGIDPYTELCATLGQVSELRQSIYESAKATKDLREIAVFEKIAGRCANTAEAIASLQVQKDKIEIGLNFAYELASWVRTQANQDPSATPQMRDWLQELLSAGLRKLEEEVRS